jgi:hypothetical protein
MKVAGPATAESLTGALPGDSKMADGLVELVAGREAEHAPPARWWSGEADRSVSAGEAGPFRQLLRVQRHLDGSCRFPGCERKRWLNAHHLDHWGNGGATNLDNLVLPCQAHHRLIHEGGWRTSGDPGRDLRFHDPTGWSRRRAPPVRRSRAPV